MNDNGPQPNAFDIETLTVANDTYRTVAWTGRYLQVTVMSIPVGESIGLETHPETDQFLRLDAGRGRAVMGPSRDDLPFSQDVEDGWAGWYRPARGTTSSTPATSPCASTRSTHRCTTHPARFTRPPPKPRPTKRRVPMSRRLGRYNPDTGLIDSDLWQGPVGDHLRRARRHPEHAQQEFGQIIGLRVDGVRIQQAHRNV